ncbi:hypothetical protein KGF56_004861 [Candida oxycetoniae]|uniref:Uncharacterized protein n=1 Tax=Candida oxycetoniae TaxID=497107 RepID=A0AAI9STD7_9ASCO|nr:uncharacterized protein KGF56_004861 [Candida oxycetoniae]KAI3402291.1 hypothetical protein KGF56_004861 [Candida oxycetoniae]
MSGKGGKVVVASVAIVASWYFGVNFWRPLIIEQLAKDGNLREDINIEKPMEEMKSWNDLRQKWNAVVDPTNNFSSEDKASLEQLKERLKKNQPETKDN